MRICVMLAVGGLAIGATSWAASQRNQKEEPPTQTLEIPKEPPSAVVADTDRLVFYVSPLSSKGLLSQQVRDALKALLGRAGRSSIVKLRAFAAGTGDIRRVQAIVSETFTARNQPIPVITVVQVGALPLPGAQVVMEATVADRKPANPHGLAFLAGQAAEEPGLPSRMVSLAREALPKLRGALGAAGLDGRDVVQATCFVSSMDDVLGGTAFDRVRIPQGRAGPYPAGAGAVARHHGLPTGGTAAGASRRAFAVPESAGAGGFFGAFRCRSGERASSRAGRRPDGFRL